ncbi:MAG: substrate-binding domain-containing protein [Ignavibacteriae bacterium]|nr:substrate-binding domain-containing protein [Ignavibacteriota bacterium]
MMNKSWRFLYRWLLGFCVCIAGCQKEPIETPTKGYLKVIVSESVEPLLRQEEQKFEELYPNAHVDLEVALAREAIARLFNDTIQVIVSSRPLNDEERDVAKQAKLSFVEYKIAVDGIAIIVNKENPVTQLRMTELESVLAGSITRWNSVGWKGSFASIDLCLPGRNSGTYEIVRRKVLHGKNFVTPSKVVNSTVDIIQFVSENSSAIGFISSNWLNEKKDEVRVLELGDQSAPDSLGGGQYFAPYQAYVYLRYYPLTREICIYSKADNYGVGAGFISFITSATGQKIVQSSGLVPATMPVRIIETTRRSLKK